MFAPPSQVATLQQRSQGTLAVTENSSGTIVGKMTFDPMPTRTTSSVPSRLNMTVVDGSGKLSTAISSAADGSFNFTVDRYAV